MVLLAKSAIYVILGNVPTISINMGQSQASILSGLVPLSCGPAGTLAHNLRTSCANDIFIRTHDDVINGVHSSMGQFNEGSSRNALQGKRKPMYASKQLWIKNNG